MYKNEAVCSKPMVLGYFTLILLSLPLFSGLLAISSLLILFATALLFSKKGSVNIKGHLGLLRHLFKDNTAIACLTFIVISSSYSLDPITSFLKASTLIFVIIVGYIVSESPVLKNISLKDHYKLLIVLVSAALLFLFLELEFAVFSRAYFSLLAKEGTFEKYQLNRTMAALTVLIWPFCFLVYVRNKLISIFFFLFASLIVMLSDSESAKLGIIVGILAFFAVTRLSSTAMLRLCFFIFLCYLFFPSIFFILNHNNSFEELMSNFPSFLHRVHIWRHTFDLISMKPVLGWGFGCEQFFTQASPIGVMYTKISKVYILLFSSHPHNMVLQILINFGFVGFILSALFFLQSSISVIIGNEPAKNIKFTMLISYLAISQSSYSIFAYWWVALPFLGLLILNIANSNSK